MARPSGSRGGVGGWRFERASLARSGNLQWPQPARARARTSAGESLPREGDHGRTLARVRSLCGAEVSNGGRDAHAERLVRLHVKQRRPPVSILRFEPGSTVRSDDSRPAPRWTTFRPAQVNQYSGGAYTRGDRRRGPEVDVELRPLSRYDRLIPA